MKKSIIGAFAFLMLFSSCKKEEPVVTNPELIVKIVLDPTQERLGNTGQPESLPSGHAGQNPTFRSLSAHYLELAPNAFTALGGGEVIYHAPETSLGGSPAIDFDQSKLVESNEVFMRMSLKDLEPGNYEWVRVSLSYQNYDVQAYVQNIPYSATIASFVGFNTYIGKYSLKTQEVVVNENKLQGYYAVETIAGVIEGQAPAITP